MTDPRFGIIGGSGLYNFEGLDQRDEIDIETPFGSPSSPVVLGYLNNKQVAFISRHGLSHRILPSEIPSRANIWALKSVNVNRIISISAVGSLDKNIAPLDFVIPDQLIDRTRMRQGTFFGNGVVAHIPFATPFCPALSQRTADTLETIGARVIRGGTCVVIEGPAFSTRAESLLYRAWNANIISMTTLPEAKLAREAEVCYCTMAAVTDYDCWQEDEEIAVNVEAVVQNMRINVQTAIEAVTKLMLDSRSGGTCYCNHSLDSAIMTSKEAIPKNRRRELQIIAGRVM